MSSAASTPQGFRFLPIVFFALLAVTLLEYFSSSKQEPPPKNEENSEQSPQAGGGLQVSSPDKTAQKQQGAHDFRFAKGREQKHMVNTHKYLAVLSTEGGRIQALYIKSHEKLALPKKVIAASKDPIAAKYQALEITRGNGMDFQPHLYYSASRSSQLGSPPLNKAAFRLSSYKTYEEAGITELHYTLPLRFRSFRLELTKHYRFYDKEHYFRQITVLRNLERREFHLGFRINGKDYYGDLYYKPFGDLGSTEGSSAGAAGAMLGGAGKFFYYNKELIKRSDFYQSAGGGCSFPAGCTSPDMDGPYSYFTQSPDSLVFMGSHSRYFFAYAEFLAPEQGHIHRPDGYLYKNQTDPEGKESMTAVFSHFRLAPRKSARLDIGDAQSLLTPEGSLESAAAGKGPQLRVLQRERSDALILDSKVYVGPRSPESHRFVNPALMQAVFGIEEPNQEAEESIHYSAYTAFFSGIQDLIVQIMRWLYQYTGNYGWAIILIALALKLLTFPLNQMQVKSMQRMSALRPELDHINKQYANNPQERQKKTMLLFRKHKVNPAKGCLPMLIQMPVFVGLYSAFSASIELWQSPFLFWIEDLSQPDSIAHIAYLDMHIRILPILMAVSQIVYQRFSSMSADPQQKMIMYIMPVMMLFFFWQIPSGVTLYWTVQNLISIVWHQISNISFK